MRFAAHSDVGKILDAEQAYYRIHSVNMSAPHFAAPLRDLRQRKAAFDTIFREYGRQIPGWARLQTMANRKIASYAFSAAGVAFERWGATDTRVAELIDFAIATYPDAPRRLAYATLRLRMCLGPKLSRLLRSIRRTLFPKKLGGRWEETCYSLGLIR